MPLIAWDLANVRRRRGDTGSIETLFIPRMHARKPDEPSMSPRFVILTAGRGVHNVPML